MKLIAAGIALLAGCKFPELPSVDPDSGDPSDDASTDGAPGPNVVITSGPAANSMTGPRVTFEFTVRDGEPFCGFDDAQLTSCTSPLAVNLSAGTHSFHVQAQNSAGGIDSDSRLWNVVCLPRQGSNETFGLFRMDEGSGTTVVNEHPATPTPPNSNIRFADPPSDPAWTTTGRFGSALRFSAQALNDTDLIYSDILMSNANIGAHSVEMWVNPAPTYPHELLLFQTSGGIQPGHMDYALKFIRSGTVGSFVLVVRNDTAMQTAMSPPLPLGSYHYVAMSYEPGTAPLLFADGYAMRVAQPVTGTVDHFFFDAFARYEGDADELHLTFHPYTENELMENWCPP